MRRSTVPPPSASMDWQSIATLIAERSNRPLILLDRASRVRMVTGAVEQALGWRRYEVEGRSWAEVFAPPELAEAARRWLAQAMRGALAQYECEACSRNGQRLLLTLDMALVGRGIKQGLLVTVREISTVHTHATDLASRDIDYRIVATATEFGALEEISGVGQAIDARRLAQGVCFDVLYGRSSPCEDCPVRLDGEWPRTAVRRLGERASSFQILTAEPSGKTSVRVSVRLIAEASLVAIHDARIAALADKAHLTERERDILHYLLLGRSLDDIATLLELSRRTVKFHQGNVLQKLGADSRTDLIRFIGF
jgi:PAS domain S-box-containing protein